jgi:hypothetical protein
MQLCAWVPNVSNNTLPPSSGKYFKVISQTKAFFMLAVINTQIMVDLGLR